jgi:hypothetical protein
MHSLPSGLLDKYQGLKDRARLSSWTSILTCPNESFGFGGSYETASN